MRPSKKDHHSRVLTSSLIYFPHPNSANEDGLLAVGGDLNPDRLLLAYQCGIFPWYNEDPILWWFTHPRCVLFPSKIKVAKSMNSYFNQKKFKVSYNCCFEQVIRNCQSTDRPEQEGTWINNDIIASYTELHKQGYAHSVEVWSDKELVGGLYGIAIGKIFYGESMFSFANNASKFGFISLVRLLQLKKFKLIDCQQETQHLKSMGAELISKDSFWRYLKNNMLEQDEKLVLDTLEQ